MSRSGLRVAAPLSPLFRLRSRSVSFLQFLLHPPPFSRSVNQRYRPDKILFSSSWFYSIARRNVTAAAPVVVLVSPLVNIDSLLRYRDDSVNASVLFTLDTNALA